LLFKKFNSLIASSLQLKLFYHLLDQPIFLRPTPLLYPCLSFLLHQPGQLFLVLLFQFLQ